MKSLRRLITKISGRGRIASGPAAGIWLVARNADPRFLDGTYEQPMLDAITAILSDGDVFYDIGANIGFFSLAAARRVGSAGVVYAFEPVPENADAIRQSVALNGLANLTVFPYAVGASTGRAELLLADHIGGASLASVATPPDLRGRIQVDVVTIDDILTSRNLRPPDVVKVDVEGAEIDVLQGMTATLNACRPKILCEVDDASLEGARRKSRRLADFFNAAGYDLAELPGWYDNGTWQVQHFLASPRTGPH